jgi:hypothetical protein
MSPRQAAQILLETTVAMHQSGTPLMRRVLPAADEDAMLWEHYPENDAVSPHNQSRYFYHCHPIEERGTNEHGHFHLFLPKSAMPHPRRVRLAPVGRRARAEKPQVVHIAALAISPVGLPTGLFTVNRWVTNEWLYPHDEIMAGLAQFDLTDAVGDPLVNQWLTALVHLAAPLISDLLAERDSRLKAQGWDGEDHALEILSRAAVDIDHLVTPWLD